MLNGLEAALQLAKAIPQFQQQQRVNPFAQALQNFSQQYGAATTDEQRNTLNTAANQTRTNFLQAGGSPNELDSKLWGSDPTQGFQTGSETYTPGYAADGMTNGQREKLASLTGLFAGQPTYQRQVSDAGLTGLFNGQKTWPRQYQEAGLSIQQQNANTSARNTAASANKVSASDIKAANLADAQSEIWGMLHDGTPLEQVEAWIVKNAGKYASGGNDYNDLIDYAWIAKTGSKKTKPSSSKSSSAKSSSTDEARGIVNQANGNPQ